MNSAPIRTYSVKDGQIVGIGGGVLSLERAVEMRRFYLDDILTQSESDHASAEWLAEHDLKCARELRECIREVERLAEADLPAIREALADPTILKFGRAA